MRRLMMMALPMIAMSAGLAACTPPAQRDAATDWDMGPMPPVAAPYDRAGPPTTLEERGAYFTQDVAAALSAPETPIDFDFRTWANDPEILNQTFALSETPPTDRAVVVTRFVYPGVGDGMIVSYTLCRRGPSDWKIEDVSGEAVPADPGRAAAPQSPPSLRAMLNLPPRTARCD